MTESENKKWYTRDDKERIPEEPHKEPSEQLWTKCPNCEKMLYNLELAENFYVCSNCDYHFRIGSRERISLLFDQNTFKEVDRNITSSDPLNFTDPTSSYSDKLKETMKKTNLKEAVITGIGKIEGIKVAAAILDFNFFGGSMGSVVGEKVTRIIEKAIKHKLPVVIVSASGGARMQESIYSLMQMAKTSAALGKLAKSKLPYISVLADPTTGGVTASFAMLGDIIIAEPGALIGFAGPRVIEQTIKQKLPEGFQKSEFLLEHGFVDIIVHRKNLKSTIAKILKMLFVS